MKKMLFILNPVAGKLLARTELFGMVNVFCKAGYTVTTAITQYSGHGAELAEQAADKEYHIIVCCGGDGTLNEIITGLLRSGQALPIGYIPTGSTNDFARTLKLSPYPIKAALAIAGGEPHTIDVGRFNDDRYFSYIATFGAFTSASYNAPQEFKNTLGQMAYVLEGVRDLAHIKSYRVGVQTESSCYIGDYVFCSVTNSTSVAGIVKLNQSIVDLRDGLFEVILVRTPKTPMDLNRIITGIANATFDNGMFEFFKATDLEFRMPENVNWSLDGEKAAGGMQVNIRNLPHSLTIYY
jgi:YegS/Rv2252/BmrU family lipid kinase